MRTRRADFESAHRKYDCRRNYDSSKRACRFKTFGGWPVKKGLAYGGGKKECRDSAQNWRTKRDDALHGFRFFGSRDAHDTSFFYLEFFFIAHGKRHSALGASLFARKTRTGYHRENLRLRIVVAH